MYMDTIESYNFISARFVYSGWVPLFTSACPSQPPCPTTYTQLLERFLHNLWQIGANLQLRLHRKRRWCHLVTFWIIPPGASPKLFFKKQHHNTSPVWVCVCVCVYTPSDTGHYVFEKHFASCKTIARWKTTTLSDFAVLTAAIWSWMSLFSCWLSKFMNALVSAWIQQPFSKDRGTQHITGTVSNEATSDMGYWIRSIQRTCFLTWQKAKPRTFRFLRMVTWRLENMSKFDSLDFFRTYLTTCTSRFWYTMYLLCSFTCTRHDVLSQKAINRGLWDDVCARLLHYTRSECDDCHQCVIWERRTSLFRAQQSWMFSLKKIMGSKNPVTHVYHSIPRVSPNFHHVFVRTKMRRPSTNHPHLIFTEEPCQGKCPGSMFHLQGQEVCHQFTAWEEKRCPQNLHEHFGFIRW